MKVAILADDLTSATDGAAPFLMRGHRCVVFNDFRHRAETDADVVALNKASRAATVEEAEKLSRVAAEITAEVPLLYQTVDSTLRGHVAVEVTSALAASGRSMAVLAPAFPGSGRTTEAGRQLLRGIPLEQTEFARDPSHPVKTAYLRRLFLGTPDTQIRMLKLDDVRALAPGDLACDGRPLVIADAVWQEDLDRLVGAVTDPASVLWCGSPGLALALARTHGGAKTMEGDRGPGSVNLFVIGSLNPLSRKQCAALSGRAQLQTIIFDKEEVNVDLAAVGGAQGISANILLTTPGDGRTDARLMARALGRAARELVGACPVTGLVLCGGDTTEAVLSELGIAELELIGEIEPGIPVARGRTPRALYIVTKAGGFGSEQVLENAANVLRGLWLGDQK